MTRNIRKIWSLFILSIILTFQLISQDFPINPPAPTPLPLPGSPGDKAYHELKEHIEYVFNEENRELPDTVTIPNPATEWKGMNRFEVLDVVRVLAQAQVVVEHGTLDPADRGIPIWIKDVRGYKKPNGWYGLRINGQPIDEAKIWFLYAGDKLNLRTFCTAGSRMVDPGLEFQK